MLCAPFQKEEKKCADIKILELCEFVSMLISKRAPYVCCEYLVEFVMMMATLKLKQMYKKRKESFTCSHLAQSIIIFVSN